MKAIRDDDQEHNVGPRISHFLWCPVPEVDMIRRELVILCMVMISMCAGSIRVFSQYAARDMFDSIGLVEQGRDFMEKNKFKKARKRFEEALQRFDINFRAHAHLAILDTIEKNHDQAQQHFENSLRTFEPYRDRLVQWKIGYVSGLERKVTEIQEEIRVRDAAEATGESVAAVPPDTESEGEKPLEEQLADLQQTIGDLWKEIELDRQMVYPAAFRARYGDLLFDRKDFEHAKQQYMLAVETDPTTRDAWANLAICWFLQGDCPEARAAFLQAKELGAAVNPNFEKDLKTLCGE